VVLLLGLALPVAFVVPLWPDALPVELELGVAFASGGGGEFGFGVGVVCCCVGFAVPLLLVLLGDVVGVVCDVAHAPSASTNAEWRKNFFMDLPPGNVCLDFWLPSISDSLHLGQGCLWGGVPSHAVVD
jgi:hypothetical protein